MAVIKHLAGRQTHELSSAHFVVGRSLACSLQLDNGLASAEHAAFHWTGANWQIRDLGSSNGTFVDQHRLGHRESVPVVVGAKIAFGDQNDVFEMVDDAAPLATAWADDGEVARAEGYGRGSILFLPDADHPLLTICEDGPGELARHFR